VIKPSDPRQLAIDLIPRSNCAVQVSAVLSDGNIYAWGWNSVGSGYGEHAEAAAIRRANKSRLFGSVIFVAGRRKRNGKIVGSKPCPACQRLLVKKGIIAMYQDSDGEWKVL
jgi:deoxycytidylate deaminase